MNRVSRRQFLSIAAGCAAAGLAGGARVSPARAAGASPPTRKPMNVLFIAVDDLRPELGCYGKAYMKTPHIDRLAARGLTFERAYCQQAVCSPSRTSLMTGCRPDTTGVYDLSTHFRQNIPKVVTLGQHFKNHGYNVHGFGKIYHAQLHDDPTWSQPLDPVNRLNGKGYPYYVSEESWAIQAAHQAQRDSRRVRGPAFEASDKPDDLHLDAEVAARSLTAMKEAVASDKPFFLASGFIKPHLPFVAPKKYWDLYDRDEIELPETFNPPLPTYDQTPEWARNTGYGELKTYAGVPDETPMPEDYARTLIHGYRACTSFMDAQVGRLLDGLEELGVADNTVVILWGDHGWHLGDHGTWCKHDNFETATHSPLIISVPGVTGGQKSAALTEFVDVYPSLAEICGLPVPAHCEGASFKPLLTNPHGSIKDAALSQYPKRNGNRRYMGRSMRTDRYRYTEWQDRETGEVGLRELYDHETDPEESVNLAAVGGHASVVEKMSAKLAAVWPASNAAALGAGKADPASTP